MALFSQSYGHQLSTHFAKLGIIEPSTILDSFNSTNPPFNTPGRPTPTGKIVFDSVTKTPWYFNGTIWLPFNDSVAPDPIPGVTPGTSISYSIIKDTLQSVVSNTDTVLAAWDATSLAIYHTVPGWDLTTGIYTSTYNQIFTLQVNISWSKGISNLGSRMLRVDYLPNGTSIWIPVKESSTQADPNLGVDTTQEIQIHLNVVSGDMIRVVVSHTAPTSLVIDGGNSTSISGLELAL
jgi:hypothetical protein